MQGQDLPGVLLSLGLRMRKPALWAVRQAFDTGALVRSWPMRGTLHVCAPEDLGWILSLTGERIITSMTTRHRELSITSSDLAEARDIAIAATGSSGLSREELLARFSAQGQSVEGQRGIHLLGSLCMQGHWCRAHCAVINSFFVASAEWIRSPRTLSRKKPWPSSCCGISAHTARDPQRFLLVDQTSAEGRQAGLGRGAGRARRSGVWWPGVFPEPRAAGCTGSGRSQCFAAAGL